MNTQDIKKIIEIFDASDSVKLKITNDNFEILLEKSENKFPIRSDVEDNNFVLQPVAKEVPVNKVEVASESMPCIINSSDQLKDIIKSPMVGTFYRAPSPDSAPYVSIGDNVKKGQTIAIIEAMKIMNEIEADFDCKIIDILVSDAKAVEFDTPLFVIERI